MSGTSTTNRFSFNAPRPIFYGWTAMIFVTGYGYYYAKQRNYAKRKQLMGEEAVEKNAAAIASREGLSQEAAEEKALARYRQGEARRQEMEDATKPQSPLQSFLDQLNKQTTQRSRGH